MASLDVPQLAPGFRVAGGGHRAADATAIRQLVGAALLETHDDWQVADWRDVAEKCTSQLPTRPANTGQEDPPALDAA